MKYPIMIIVAILIFACNKKDDKPAVDPVSPENKAKAAALSEFLKNDKLRLTKYYSETPIDYIDTDQVVLAEEDLWKYVSLWLKDDTYSFDATSGKVIIDQNADRIETDTAAVLTRDYSVQADADGVAFKFIGHEYQTLGYRLIAFTDTNLVVSADWHGNKVISEYKTVP